MWTKKLSIKAFKLKMRKPIENPNNSINTFNEAQKGYDKFNIKTIYPSNMESKSDLLYRKILV